MPFFFSVPAGDLCIGCTGKFVRYCFCCIQICRPLLSELHAEIAAVISTPQRHASLPDQLWMQAGIADVITVAKAAAQLRAAVFCACVVIWTFHHIHTPYTVADLQLLWVKARRRAEDAPCGKLYGNACSARCRTRPERRNEKSQLYGFLVLIRTEMLPHRAPLCAACFL